MNNKIALKVALVATIICICALGALVVLAHSDAVEEIDIHAESIFVEDDDIVGTIPATVFEAHICELWKGNPVPMSGIYLYDIDTDQWIWCQ